MSLYFLPFALAFSIAIAGLFFLDRQRRRARRSGDAWKRSGGVAFLGAFLAAIVLDPNLVLSRPILGMIAGCCLILVFGIFDDRFRFGWKPQFVFQAALVGMLLASGFQILSIPAPFLGSISLEAGLPGEVFGAVVLFVWVILLINAVNWADGVDGLLPSLALVSSATLFVLSLFPEVNQPPLGILSVALFGSALGLFLFNFPPARLFAGTSGSFGVAFLLAAISVLSGTKIATALLVLALPTADALLVIVERIRSGASPFRGGDRRHLHFRLRDLGWSDRAIVALYSALAVLSGMSALLFRSLGKFAAIAIVFVGLFFLIYEVRRISNCK